MLRAPFPCGTCGQSVTVGHVEETLLVLDAEPAPAGGFVSWPDDVDRVPSVHRVSSPLYEHAVHMCGRTAERGS